VWSKGDYRISTDRSLLNFAVIHDFIANKSYWGQGRSQETMRRAIENSTFCFGLYECKGKEIVIGFARVISDLTMIGYLSDVFVVEGYRGKGLGRWLIESIVNHPDLRELKRLILFTRTPDFYANQGFGLYDQEKQPAKFLELKREQ
jgi:N-acetylglutamate synthase-like GNAT family acetyltransferase